MTEDLGEFFQELRREYLAEAPARLGELRKDLAAVRSGEPDAVPSLKARFHRLAGSGVHVMIVRPGFVHTKMTAGMEAAPMSVTADVVASAIVKGHQRGSEVVWVPMQMRAVMSGLRHLPRAVFRRLPF